MQAVKNMKKVETVVVTEEFDGTYDIKGITREELQIIYVVLCSVKSFEISEKTKEYKDVDGPYYRSVDNGRLSDFDPEKVIMNESGIYKLYEKFQEMLTP